MEEIELGSEGEFEVFIGGEFYVCCWDFWIEIDDNVGIIIVCFERLV